MQKTFSQETLENLRKAPFFSKPFFFKILLFLGVMTFIIANHIYFVTTFSGYWFRTQVRLQHYDLPQQIRISESYHDGLTANSPPERRAKAYALARAFSQDETSLLKMHDAVQKEDAKEYKKSVDGQEKRHFTRWYYAVFFSMALFAVGVILLRRYLRRLGILGKTLFFSLRVATPSALRWGVILIVLNQFIIPIALRFVIEDLSEFFVGAGSPEQQRIVDQYAIEHGLLCSRSMEKVNRLVWEAFQERVERFILLVNVLSIAIYGFLTRRWSKE